MHTSISLSFGDRLQRTDRDRLDTPTHMQTNMDFSVELCYCDRCLYYLFLSSFTVSLVSETDVSATEGNNEQVYQGGRNT